LLGWFCEESSLNSNLESEVVNGKLVVLLLMIPFGWVLGLMSWIRSGGWMVVLMSCWL
jgi:hypothetical protein